MNFQRVNLEICSFEEQQPRNNPCKVANTSAISGLSSSAHFLQLSTPYGTSVRKFWMLEWLFRNHKERGNQGKKGVHLADLGCQDFDQPGLGAFLLSSNHPKFAVSENIWSHGMPWPRKHSHSRCRFSHLLIPIRALGKLVAATPKIGGVETLTFVVSSLMIDKQV